MFEGYDSVTAVGEGGLGRVYRARRVSTGGEVAIKELRDIAESSPVWHRARREVTALLRLKGHPFVVSVEELIQGPHGPCLVMEFAPGGSLFDRMLVQQFSVGELVLIGQQVSNALNAAHAVGIVHRDIKPQNLLIGAFGQVKVCDFGISSLVRDGGERTATSAFTLAYASPEEIDGAGHVGPAADVYSFGATMLHLMLGRRLTFKDRADGPAADFGEVTSGLRPVEVALRSCLAHSADDRPTMSDLQGLFDEVSHAIGNDRVRAVALSRSVGAPAVDPNLPAASLSFDSTADLTVVRRVEGPAPLAPPPQSDGSMATVVRSLPSTAVTEPEPAGPASLPQPGDRKRQLLVGALFAVIVAVIGVGALVIGDDDSPSTAASSTGSIADSSTAAQVVTTSVDSLAVFRESFPNLDDFFCGELEVFGSGSEFVNCDGGNFYVGRLPNSLNYEDYLALFDNTSNQRVWRNATGEPCGIEVDFYLQSGLRSGPAPVILTERLFYSGEVYVGFGEEVGFPRGLKYRDDLCEGGPPPAASTSTSPG